MRCHSTFKGGSRFLVGKASWESEPGTVAFLSPGLGSETHLGRTEGVSPAQEKREPSGTLWEGVMEQRGAMVCDLKGRSGSMACGVGTEI